MTRQERHEKGGAGVKGLLGLSLQGESDAEAGGVEILGRVVSQRKLQSDCQRDRLSRASGVKLLWAQGETLFLERPCDSGPEYFDSGLIRHYT